MALLGTATKVYSGASVGKKVYLGDTLVWPLVAPPVGDATLAGQDGDWIAKGWGTSGWVLADGSSTTASKSPPPGVTVTATGPEYSWAPSTTHTSGMMHSGGTYRVACCWYGVPLDLSLTFAQAWKGTVRFYFMSQATDDRSQSVTPFLNNVAQGPTLDLLATDPLTWYGSGQVFTDMLPGGRWLAYDLNMAPGDVFKLGMHFLGGGGGNVVISGVVFDAAGPTWDSDTQAYLTATGLNVSYAPALDGLVRGLKQYGLWTKMNVIYPFIGGTEALHKWNLKDPRDLDAAYRLSFVVGTGSGSHSTALGYRPNAQGVVANGGYADTRLVPSSVLSLNSTHLAYYSLADVPPISRCEMGCYNWAGSGSRFHIIARYTPNGFYYGQCEDGATYGTVPASSGLFVSTRTAVDFQAGYRNGALVASSANGPATGLPPVPIWVGGINSFGDRSDLPCGFASIGSGLTAQNVADLSTVVRDYQTALGRQTPL